MAAKGGRIVGFEPNRELGLPLTDRQLRALAGRARKPRVAITQFRRGKTMACEILGDKLRAQNDDSVELRASLYEWWRSGSTMESFGPRFSWGYNQVLTDIAAIIQGDTFTINWNIGKLPESQRRTR